MENNIFDYKNKNNRFILQFRNIQYNKEQKSMYADFAFLFRKKQIFYGSFALSNVKQTIADKHILYKLCKSKLIKNAYEKSIIYLENCIENHYIDIVQNNIDINFKDFLIYLYNTIKFASEQIKQQKKYIKKLLYENDSN